MLQGKNKRCRPWYSWLVENKALGIYAKTLGIYAKVLGIYAKTLGIYAEALGIYAKFNDINISPFAI